MKKDLLKTILLGQSIGKYLTRSESGEDKEIIDSWLNENSENEKLMNSIHSNKNLIHEFEMMDSIDKKIALERIKEKILLRSKTRALMHWKIAASILILVGVIGILYIFSGNFIELNNKNTLYTSVFTENGQRSKVILPDSSIVWLNSGTTLSYPTNFSERNRNVIVKGQAFFQVAHKKSHPFLVQINGLIVKVLGTKFDVYAYPEEDEIVVVLESGKVELMHKELDFFSYIMKPGEKATINLSDNRNLNITNVDPEIYSSWKEGKLSFRNSPIDDVTKKLKKWYDVDIEIRDSDALNSIFSGTITNESYEEIFRLIGIACNLDCKVIHNYNSEAKPQIIISKKNE